MDISRVSWVLYLVGSLLVFGSWIDVVPAGLAWTGWLMAIAGWAIGHRMDRTPPGISKAEELEKLDGLRQRGAITDAEFQREKERVLEQPS
jgi:hypothetical protein